MTFQIYLISNRGANRWQSVDTPKPTFTYSYAEEEQRKLQWWGGPAVLEFEPTIRVFRVTYDRIQGTDCYLERHVPKPRRKK